MLLALLINVFSASVMAANQSVLSNTASTNKQSIPKNKKSKTSTVEFISSMLTSTNMYKPSSLDHFISLDLSLTGRFALNKLYKLSTSVNVNHDLKLNRSTSLLDTPVVLSRQPIKLKGSKFSPRYILTLPTNELNRINNTFRCSLAAGGTLSTTVTVANFSFDASYTLTAKKNFHQFKRNNTNSPNKEYSLGNTVSLSKALKIFSFSISASYANSWDYFNNITPVFSVSESIDYQINKNTSLSFGHANSGGALDYDGVTNNIEVFNKKSSQVFVGLTILNK